MVGIDLCSVTRIRRLCEKHSDRFTTRVFTGTEMAHASARRDPYPHLAARWAVKEAVIKILGMPPGFRYTDVEVVNGPDGRPALRLDCAMAARARQACQGD